MEAEVEVIGFSKRGRGLARFGAHEVEVPGTVPGDRARVLLSRPRRGLRKGILQEVVTASSLRTQPRCRHVPQCGGCSWQQFDYAGQLREKERVVREAFAFSTAPQLPILPCTLPWYYRNKMEFSFSQNRVGERFLGLMRTEGRGRVLNLTECHLTAPWYIALLAAVRAWWEESGLLAYKRNGEGSLRTLTLREGQRTGDKMALLTVSGTPAYALSQKQLDHFCRAVREVAPEASIFLQIQQAVKGSPTQFFERHLGGADHIREELEIEVEGRTHTLLFKISPTSFFQPNPLQAEQLYSAALRMTALPAGALVYDLYAGMATLGMAFALKAKQVVAVELNPHALFDAEAGAKRNGIHNLSLLCGDVGCILAERVASSDFTPPDLAIVDPPRAGLDPKAINALLALRAKKILYISCNPRTQAENIRVLEEKGYALALLQPVDQFPHTPHIENIGLLNSIV